MLVKVHDLINENKDERVSDMGFSWNFVFKKLMSTKGSGVNFAYMADDTKLNPIRCFKIDEDTYALLKESRESMGVTWNDFLHDITLNYLTYASRRGNDEGSSG